jgi:PAS domain-containing protein
MLPALSSALTLEMLDRTNDAVAVHRDFRILYANAAYARLYGFASGAELMAVEPMLWIGIPQDRWDDARSDYARIMAGEDLGVRRLELVAVRQERMTMELREHRVSWLGEPAIWFSLRDVKPEIAPQHRHVRGALDVLPLGVIAYDDADRIMFSNQRFHDIFRVLPEPEVIAGWRFADLLVFAERAASEAALDYPPIARVLAERDPSLRPTLHRINRRWFEVRSSSMAAGALVCYRDVHEETLAQQRAREREARLHARVSELRTA